MPSEYIVADDYAAFGLPSGTTQAQVLAASAVINGFLSRPLGAVFQDGDLPIIEDFSVPRGTQYVTLSYTPVVEILSVVQRVNGEWVSLQGAFDVDQYGACWFDAPNVVLLNKGRLRITYTAGWTYADLPLAIKQATANVINNAASVALPGNIKMMKAGDSAIQRFDDTTLDSDTRSMLLPYRRLFA